MLRTCKQTTDIQESIHTDGRRQDGRTIGRTNELKENIQTDRVTNNLTKICIQANGRTHTQTILELEDRQTNRNIHKTV